MAQVTLGAPGDPKSLRSLPDASQMPLRWHSAKGLIKLDQVLDFILDIYVVSIKHMQKIHPPEPTKSYIIESLMRDRPPIPPLLEMETFDTHLFRWV